MQLFVLANKETASANAILLQYSAPVWAAILGWLLLRERPAWNHWLSLLMVAGGMLVFFHEGLAVGHLRGDLFAALSGLFFGVQSVFLRMQKNAEPSDSLLLSHILCFLICIPSLGGALSGGTLVLDAPSIASILFMGIFQIGAASLLFSAGIKRISAFSAMLTAMIEPVLNPVWVLLVTGEAPSLAALFGGLVIIAAVVVASFRWSSLSRLAPSH
jgi:drug/metabolite transporter (DMT)-like permease